MKTFLPLLLSACLAPALFSGETPRRGGFAYPPEIAGAQTEVYKKVGDTELKVWIFQPKSGTKPHPAIVFFFGGGWSSGSPVQFERQCRHLAELGMVAITADYRVTSRQRIKPAQCVADAKSCMRWVRANAERLGIDPNKLAAGGGSAGGHLAGAVATLPGLDDSNDDLKISCVPNALVLFNPALVLAPVEGLDLKGFGADLTPERLGCEREAFSPIHHLKAGLPPTLIQHGRADTTVPYVTVEAFAEHMQKLGNRCELIGYDDQKHGFFNQIKYDDAVRAMDAFLASLGYIAADGAAAKKEN